MVRKKRHELLVVQRSATNIPYFSQEAESLDLALHELPRRTLSDDIRYKILPGIHEIPVAKRHGLHEAEDKVSKLITRLPETLGFTATSVVAKKGFVGLIPDKDTSKVILSEQRRVFNVLHIRLLPPNLEPLFITRRYMNEAAATTVVEALAHDMQIHPELFHITLGSLTVQAKTPKKP